MTWRRPHGTPTSLKDISLLLEIISAWWDYHDFDANGKEAAILELNPRKKIIYDPKRLVHQDPKMERRVLIEIWVDKMRCAHAHWTKWSGRHGELTAALPNPVPIPWGRTLGTCRGQR